MRKFFLLMAAALSLSAMEPAATGEWLVQHRHDAKLVIVDVTRQKEYGEGHIPGAVQSGIERWRKTVGEHAEVRSMAEIGAEMRRLGIDNDSTVVVYSHQLNNKDMLKATYVLWAMEYAGLKSTALLDGGMDAYTAAGGSLSKQEEADRAGHFRVKADGGMIAALGEVKASLNTVPMIDSRPAVYYFGAQRQSVLKRAGHISGATSYFWRYSVTDDNRLKPKALLSEMIEKGLGLKRDAPLIVYCTGGLEASMNYFVFHRLLGFTQAALYDASMKEWGNREDTPMRAYRWE